jgi:hypothetical protein
MSSLPLRLKKLHQRNKRLLLQFLMTFIQVSVVNQLQLKKLRRRRREIKQKMLMMSIVRS